MLTVSNAGSVHPERDALHVPPLDELTLSHLSQDHAQGLLSQGRRGGDNELYWGSVGLRRFEWCISQGLKGLCTLMGDVLFPHISALEMESEAVASEEEVLSGSDHKEHEVQGSGTCCGGDSVSHSRNCTSGPSSGASGTAYSYVPQTATANVDDGGEKSTSTDNDINARSSQHAHTVGTGSPRHAITRCSAEAVTFYKHYALLLAQEQDFARACPPFELLSLCARAAADYHQRHPGADAAIPVDPIFYSLESITPNATAAASALANVTHPHARAQPPQVRLSQMCELLSTSRRVAQQSGGMVAMTIINNLFVNFTRNWLCNVARMNVYQRVVIVTVDDEAYESLRNNEWGIAVVRVYFDTKGMVHLTYNKIGYALFFYERAVINFALLASGIDVFVFETDAVWTHDAFQYIRQRHATDITGFLDARNYMGGGFLSIRSNERTAQFWRKMVTQHHEYMRTWWVGKSGHDEANHVK